MSSRMSDDMEAQYAAHITDYTTEHGVPPSVREIAFHFGVAHGTAQHHLARMVEKGLLKRAPGVARGISIAGAVMKQETHDV